MENRILLTIAAFILAMGLAVESTAEPSTVNHASSSPEQVGRQTYTPPEDIQFKGDKVLIVTHNCSNWDGECTTKPGADATILYARENGIPIVYLQHKLNDPSYFCELKKPDYISHSRTGEFHFKVPVRRVLSTGGYFSFCHRNTMLELLDQWAKSGKDYEITLVTPAMYEMIGSGEFGNPEDKSLSKAQWTAFEKKMKSLRTPNSHAARLSDILNQFPSDESAAEHLAYRLRDSYSLTKKMPDHKIVLQYRGITKTIQDPRKKDTPTIQFRFLNPDRMADLPAALSN